MKKRYVLKAVFDDPDFDMQDEGKRYWTKSGALKDFDRLEAERRFGAVKTGKWHYEVRDSLTGELLASDY